MPRNEETSRIGDRIRYEHVRDAARDIVLMTAGRSRTDLATDMLLRRALIHAIREIGEAAARMSEAGRALCPEVPWPSVVEMRNVVVHVYWGVNLDLVWQVAVGHVPPLIALAERAIASLPLPPDAEAT
jgi:uncharacterized protein with HEPN domain